MANDTIVQYILKLNAKNAQKGLDQTAKSADKTSKEFDDLDKSGEKLNKELGKTGKQSKKATSSLKGLSGGAKVAAIGISAVGAAGLAAVAGVVALSKVYIRTKKAAFDFTREVVDSVNNLNDLSAQSGLTASSIQAVETAFVGSGQSASAAASFISRFPRLFADLESGAGRASEAAEKLGVSLKDASGKTKDADEILKDITNGLQAIENPTERATTGFLLFGRSAGQFLQAFGATSNFENFVAITDRFGVKTGPRASAEAAKFQEQLAILHDTTKGLKQQFVNAVGGVGIFNKLLTKAITVVVTLQDFIAENEKEFQRFGRSLVNVSSSVLKALQGLLTPFSSFMVATFNAVTNSMFFLVRVMRSVGKISNKTFHDIKDATDRSQASMRMLANLIADLAVVDFSGETGAGVGGRTGAKDVQAMLDKLLSGITKSSQGAVPEVNKLSEGITELGKSAQETQKLFDLEATTPAALKLIEDIEQQFANLDPAIIDAQDTIKDLENAIIMLGLAGLDSSRAQFLLAEAETRLVEARKKAEEELIKQAKQQRQKDALAVISLVEQIASLDVATIAGAMNPVAGAIVGAVQTIGSKTPKEMREEITAQAQAIKNGIAILPELILSIIPQLAIAITEAIIDGLALFFINLKNLLVDFFTMDRGERQERRERRRQAIRDFFDPSESLSYASGGRFVPSAQGGIRFTGMQDGMAMLHRGEFVVPQSGQRPQQVDRQLNRSSGGMVININSAVVDRNAVDALVREIEIRFNNTFGTSSSNLFGGR